MAIEFNAIEFALDPDLSFFLECFTQDFNDLENKLREESNRQNIINEHNFYMIKNQQKINKIIFDAIEKIKNNLNHDDFDTADQDIDIGHAGLLRDSFKYRCDDLDICDNCKKIFSNKKNV